MEVKMIDMKDIVTNPLQPRQTFDREKLQELADSIKEGELLQPIVVRTKGKKFEIVCGERRYKAFQILKEPKIPAIVRVIKDDTDALEKSYIENTQRVDLTSVEDENTIKELWKSKRYDTEEILANKLGQSKPTINRKLMADAVRDKLNLGPRLSTSSIDETRGLSDEPRKKLLGQIEEGKIGTREVRDVVRKVKEFPEPEQQMAILEEFENAEDQTKDALNHIIQRKKDIADGKREPEHIIQVETDTDQRLIDSYKQIKTHVFEIFHDHILHMKSDKKRKEAIKLIWDIHNFTRKELEKLGEIQVVG